MAPDGRCKTFDARANGYVRGEGAGVVVLKPLAQALADGDPIYAVIRGSAVNQDGRSNGLMAPNPHAQEAVLRAGLSAAPASQRPTSSTSKRMAPALCSAIRSRRKRSAPFSHVDRPPRQPMPPRLGQNQPRSPRGRRRHRRIDQGRALAQASRAPGESPLRGAQSSYSFRRASAPREHGAT